METKESTKIKPEKIEKEQTSNDKQHSAESAYTCNICLMVFKYPAMILHHVKTVHNIRPFKCDHCSLSFNKRGILKRHIEKKHNIKKPKLKSVLLDYRRGNVDSTKTSDAKEKSTSNPLVNRNRYKCAQCSRSFRKRKFFNHHVKNCGVSNQHQSNVIQNEPLIPENKDKSNPNNSPNDSQIKQDIIISENMSMNCFVNVEKMKIKTVKQDDINLKSFINATIDTEENNIVSEDDCNDAAFDSEENAESFSKSTEEEYKCSNCPMTFNQFSNLFIHLKNVHKLKPYSCPMCTLRFNRKKTLDKHMELNHNEGVKTIENNNDISPTSLKLDKGNVYKCTLCVGSFSQRTFLDLHMKSHSEAEQNSASPKDDQSQKLSPTFENILPVERNVQEHDNEQKTTLSTYKCDPTSDNSSRSAENETRHNEKIICVLNEKSNITKYECHICYKTFAHKHQLEPHLNMHTGHKPFKCPKCSYRSAQSNNIRGHLRRKHNAKPYKCSTCYVEFDIKENLLTHLRVQHDIENPKVESVTKTFRDPTYKYSVKMPNKDEANSEMFKNNPTNWCHVCNKKFPAKSLFENHMRCHTGERPFKCTHCDFRGSLSINILQHLLQQHDVKPFKCSKCDERFKSNRSLKDHLIETHNVRKPKVKSYDELFRDKSYNNEDSKLQAESNQPNKCKCSQCSKTFNHMGDLIPHLKNEHNIEQLHKCPKCNDRFNLKLSLIDHLRMVHNSEKSIIEKSYEMFRNDNVANSQLINNTGNEDYGTDVVKVTNEYEKQSTDKVYRRTRHQCHICNKVLASSAHFKIHLRVHTGERPYKCKICPKSYPYTQQLLDHLVQDHGDRPFACDRCEKKFYFRNTLIDHLKMDHLDENPKLETVSSMLLKGTESGKEMATQSNDIPSTMTPVDSHEEDADEIIIDDTPMFTEANTHSIFNYKKGQCTFLTLVKIYLVIFVIKLFKVSFPSDEIFLGGWLSTLCF